jgi:magnesium transporter
MPSGKSNAYARFAMTFLQYTIELPERVTILQSLGADVAPQVWAQRRITQACSAGPSARTMTCMTTLGTSDLAGGIDGHIRTSFTAVQADETIAQVLTRVRSHPPQDQILYFYVVDADGRLVGVVPTRRLLVNPVEQTISAIMISDVVTVSRSATLKEACEQFLTHRFLAFPVVDDDRRLVGVIDIGEFTDELLDIVERRSFDDIFRLIGVHLSLDKKAPAWASFKDRFPWLLCNIGGGIACALIAGLYEAFLNRIIVLALFIPVVLALSESVSIQSVTITLQSLHRGAMSGRFLWRSIAREILVALMLGTACGATVGVVDWLWKGNPAVALAIAASILLAMLTACLIGVALPTALHRLKLDPRVAAGPIVLAVADVLTLLFYFNVSGLILG